jgi:hypothetical protein
MSSVLNKRMCFCGSVDSDMAEDIRDTGTSPTQTTHRRYTALILLLPFSHNSEHQSCIAMPSFSQITGFTVALVVAFNGALANPVPFDASSNLVARYADNYVDCTDEHRLKIQESIVDAQTLANYAIDHFDTSTTAYAHTLPYEEVKRKLTHSTGGHTTFAPTALVKTRISIGPIVYGVQLRITATPTHTDSPSAAVKKIIPTAKVEGQSFHTASPNHH